MHGLILGTILFLIIWLVSAIIIGEYVAWQTEKQNEKNDNRTLAWGLTFLAIVCMWLMWFTAYLHQMNPIILPKS